MVLQSHEAEEVCAPFYSAAHLITLEIIKQFQMYNIFFLFSFLFAFAGKIISSFFLLMYLEDKFRVYFIKKTIKVV